MHVRAYNYWVSLLDGRDFPVDRGSRAERRQRLRRATACCSISPAAAIIPAMPYIGTAIREECGLDEDVRTIAEVPSRSLLSRLTDHYLQIIANRAPIGFEAEFVNQRGENICYRGILMPFSSDGDTIDFIYGVINWKTVARGAGPAGRRRTVAARADRRGPTREEIASRSPEEHLCANDGPSIEDPRRHPRRADDPAPLGGPSTGSGRRATSSTRSPQSWSSRCRPRRPAVGRARNRRSRQVGRRPHPRRALPGAVAGL